MGRKRLAWAAAAFCLTGGAFGASALDQADALFKSAKYEKAAAAYVKVAKENGATSEIAGKAMLGAVECLYREKAYASFRSAAATYLKSVDGVSESDEARRLKVKIASSYYAEGQYATATLKLAEYVENHASDLKTGGSAAKGALFEAVAKLAAAKDKSGAGGGRELLLKYAEEFSDAEKSGRLRLYAAAALRKDGDVASYKKELAAIPVSTLGAASRLLYDVQLELAQAAKDEGEPTSAAQILTNYIDKYPASPYAGAAAAKRDNYFVRARKYAAARSASLAFAEANAGAADATAARFRAAQSLYAEGKYSDFVTSGTALLKEHPDFDGKPRERFEFQMAVAPLKTGDAGEAANLLEIFLNNYPQSNAASDARIYLGAARVKLGDRYAAADNATSATAELALGREALKSVILRLKDEITSKTASNSPLRTKILDAHYFAKDYDGLTSDAQALIDEQTTHGLLWAKATFWRGVARTLKTPADLSGAAADLDAVINSGIADGNINTHIESMAARWRVYVAAKAGDAAALAALGPKIEALPDGPFKAKSLAAWQRATGK